MASGRPDQPIQDEIVPPDRNGFVIAAADRIEASGAGAGARAFDLL
jgi:hypothetical protein